MTQLPLHQAPQPPSWIPPIAVGSMFTLLVMFGTTVLPSAVPPLVACCCCLAQPLPVGVLPAMLALRRDPELTVGQGFAVSFIAVGLGAAVMALLMIAQWDGQQQQQVEQVMRQSLEEMNASGVSERRLTEEEIDTAVSTMVRVTPYIPAIVALVLSVVGGFLGLITVAVLRRRRPPPPMPEPV